MGAATDATVSGGNILSMLAAMGAFRKSGEQILDAHGITNATADAWYPLDRYVAALNDIEARIGPNTLFRVGQEIPNHIKLPPGLDAFEKVIGSFGPAFSMNHRGAGAGGITFEITTSDTGVITSGTPYPCDFDRGVIQGFFRKLVKGTLNYRHDAESCKKKGATTCVHHVSMRTSAA
jgi:hypothetical protein